MKTCAFVFGEREEQVIPSSRFLLQLGHCLFPRDVGVCSVLNGACKGAEKSMPSRRNGAHTGSRGGSHGLPGMRLPARVVCAQAEASKRAERQAMEAETTDLCQDSSVLKDLVRGQKFPISDTGENSTAGYVASLTSEASMD